MDLFIFQVDFALRNENQNEQQSSESPTLPYLFDETSIPDELIEVLPVCTRFILKMNNFFCSIFEDFTKHP